MNTDVQMSIQVSALCSFGYLPKSGIAGSHAYFMFPFFFFFDILFILFYFFYLFFNSCQTASPSSFRNFFFNVLIIVLQYNWFLHNPMHFL